MHTTNKISLLLRNAAHGVGLLPVLFVALFVAVLLSACSSDSGNEEPETSTRTVDVTLTLAVNPTSNSGAANSKSFTRTTRSTTFTDGTWDPIDHPEAGVGFENYIDADRLHVVFYKQDGSRLAEVQNKVLLTTDNASVYQIKGSMRIAADGDLNSPVTFNGKVVVYANVDAPTGESPAWSWQNDLKALTDNATFSYSAPTTATPAGISNNGMAAIPMWGIQDYSTNAKELKAGLYNDLGTIYLLRSMAKVSLHFTAEMREAGFQFTEVKLNNYNPAGTVAPPYSNFSSLASTTALTYAQSFHLPTSISSDTTNPLDFLAAEGDTVSLNLYIPEYRNVTTEDSRTGTLASSAATITVGIRRVLNGVTTNYTVSTRLHFADYTDGKRADDDPGYDIVRNHHYRYFILNDHLDLRLVVEPWTVVRHSKPIEI